MILELPARVPSSQSRQPSDTWHNTNVTRLDTVKGNFKTNAFDGALMRRLCAEYPYLLASGERWRLVMYVAGVHRRGLKTLRQLDAEGWDYDTIAGRIEALIERLTRHEVRAVQVVQFEQLGLPLAA